MTHEWPSPSPLHSLRRRGRKGEGRGTAKPFAKNVAALLLLLLLPLSSLFRPLSKSCFSALLRIRPFDRRRRRRMEAQWAEEEWGEIFGSPSLSLSTACVFQYPLPSSSPPLFSNSELPLHVPRTEASRLTIRRGYDFFLRAGFVRKTEEKRETRTFLPQLPFPHAHAPNRSRSHECHFPLLRFPGRKDGNCMHTFFLFFSELFIFY